MNALQEYLNKNKETVSGFALRTCIPQATVWRIVNNKFTPSPGTALKIEQATNGRVDRMELLYPEKDQTQETK